MPARPSDWFPYAESFLAYRAVIATPESAAPHPSPEMDQDFFPGMPVSAIYLLTPFYRREGTRLPRAPIAGDAAVSRVFCPAADCGRTALREQKMKTQKAAGGVA